MMRTIEVCAGIGDNIWILQKLINAKEKFNFKLANDKPQRGKQLFDLVPQICNDSKYAANFDSSYPIVNNIQIEHKRFGQITDKVFPLSANRFLEKGNRIEDFLSDLPISFNLKFNTKEFKSDADSLLPNNKKTKYIGIYTSSYSTSRHWGFWNEHKWFDLINEINKSGEFKFVLIGADFDIDLNAKLIQILNSHHINTIPIIGKELGLAVEIMKRLDYFIAFPSGLPILSTTLRKRTLMFYPDHLKGLMHSWPDKKLIENQTYTAQLFSEPGKVFNWLKNEYQLFDKLN